MIKKTIITIASIIVVALLYNFYCDHFWENYINDQFQESEKIEHFRFKVENELSSGAVLSKNNFQKYTWNRELLELNHANWINDVELYFTSDSTLFYRVTARDISNNYWTYPIFKKFKCNEDETFTHSFNYDKETMSFVDHKQDTVKIEIDKNNLIIEHFFL